MLMGLVAALVAQSPPPPPSPAKATQEKQQLSNGQIDSGNPSQKPITRPEGSDKYAESYSNQSDDKSSTNWWIAIFTGILTIVGVLQYCAMRKQAGYMRRGLIETKRAVDAANKSADAAMETVKTSRLTERAIVLIDSVIFNTGELRYESIVLFTLKNFGRTIADSVELTGELVINAGALLDNARDETRQWTLDQTSPATIAPQGTNTWITRSIGIWTGVIDEALIKTINHQLTKVQYNINVTYVDAFKESHRYRCEGRYEPALGKFIITSSTSD